MGKKDRGTSNNLTVMCISNKGPVRRFKVRPGLFRLAVVLLVVLLLGFAALGTLWYKSRHETLVLKDRIKALEQELKTNKVELVRLKNMERMSTTYERGDMEVLLGAHRNETVRHEPARTVDLNTILSPVDRQLISVKNVQAGLDDRVLEVSFEINNLDAGTKVAGRFLYHLVSSSGEVVELSGEDQGRGFEIRYFNRIESVFDLPEGLRAEEIYGLKLVVEDDSGEVIYRETFAFSSILV